MDAANSLTFHFHRNKSGKDAHESKQQRLSLISSVMVSIINWTSAIVLSILLIYSWTLETDTDVWDMKQHCADSKFNQTSSDVPNSWPLFWTLCNSSLVLALMAVRSCIIKDRRKRDRFNYANFIMGIFVNWAVTSVAQKLIGYPRPGFYKNPILNSFYCCTNCTNTSRRQFTRLDSRNRGSFPSSTMSFGWYSASYLHMYVESAERSESFVAGVFFCLPSCLAFCYFGYLFYIRHQSHLEDIIGGALIGILLGVFMGKSLSRDTKQCSFGQDLMTVIMNREGAMFLNQATDFERNNSGRTVNEYTLDVDPEEEEQEQEREGQNGDARIYLNRNNLEENVELHEFRSGTQSSLNEEPPPAYTAIAN